MRKLRVFVFDFFTSRSNIKLLAEFLFFQTNGQGSIYTNKKNLYIYINKKYAWKSKCLSNNIALTVIGSRLLLCFFVYFYMVTVLNGFFRILSLSSLSTSCFSLLCSFLSIRLIPSSLKTNRSFDGIEQERLLHCEYLYRLYKFTQECVVFIYITQRMHKE